MKIRSKNITLLLTCFWITFCQIATSCDNHAGLTAKTRASVRDTAAVKELPSDGQKNLDEFLGTYTSVCKGDKKIYLTLNIKKTGTGYIATMKGFPDNATIVTGMLQPDSTNFDPNLDVWAVTDNRNYRYGFLFNKKYLAELFSGCLVLDNVDYKPTINNCFIADKQDNIVFCKQKKH